MNGITDPKRLRLNRPRSPKPVGLLVPRHMPGELFLKGPIPWSWLSLAANQSGKALHVAVVLWFLVGVKRVARVQLMPSKLRAFGVTRHSAARGLRQLEAGGLVSVERRPGCSPLVTVLDGPQSDTHASQ